MVSASTLGIVWMRNCGQCNRERSSWFVKTGRTERIRLPCIAGSGAAKVSSLWAAAAQRSSSVRLPALTVSRRRSTSSECDLGALDAIAGQTAHQASHFEDAYGGEHLRDGEQC